MQRLSYLRYLGTAGFWRWSVARLDSIIVDHVKPWTQIPRREKTHIHPTVTFRRAENIEIASHVRIQPYCALWASPKAHIRIGQYTGLGPGTLVFSSNHQFAAGIPFVQQPWTERPVTIGRDVWIGAGCVILPGVEIGDGAIVAAGSIVSRSVPANTIVAGVPARPIGVRGETAVDAPRPAPAPTTGHPG